MVEERRVDVMIVHVMIVGVEGGWMGQGRRVFIFTLTTPCPSFALPLLTVPFLADLVEY